MMKRNRLSVYSVVIMALYFLGIIVPFHNIMLGVLLLAYLIFATQALKLHSIEIPKIIIGTIIFQNTFIGIGCHVFGAVPDEVTIYSQVPTLFIAITAGIILLGERNRKKHILFYAYLIVILIYCFVGERRSFMTYAYNIRNLTVFYFAYTLGGYFVNSEEKCEELRKFLIRWSVFSGVVGLIGTLTNGQLYVAMGAQEVARVKTNRTQLKLYDNGLTGNFHGDFFGYTFWRMGSLFLEPVNYSSFLALAVVLSLVRLRNAKDYLIFYFLLICQLLTFGKGGLLISGMTILIYWFGKVLINNMGVGIKNALFTVRWNLLLLVCLLGIVYGTVFSYNFHFYAIRITLRALLRNPMGFGVGSSGNVSNSFNSTTSYIGAETGLLNFWCQIGFFGLMLFALLIYRMSKITFSRFVVEHSNECFIFSVLPMLLLLVFIFQENTFTTQVITSYMLFLGYYGGDGGYMIFKREKL